MICNALQYGATINLDAQLLSQLTCNLTTSAATFTIAGNNILRVFHSLILLQLKQIRDYDCRKLINADNGVFLGSQTDDFGVVDGVGAVLFVDAAEQVGGVVGGGHLLVVDDIDAGLVEGDGVGGGQNADVLDARCGRMSVAVAVYLLIRFNCL